MILQVFLVAKIITALLGMGKTTSLVYRGLSILLGATVILLLPKDCAWMSILMGRVVVLILMVGRFVLS